MYPLSNASLIIAMISIIIKMSRIMMTRASWECVEQLAMAQRQESDRPQLSIALQS